MKIYLILIFLLSRASQAAGASLAQNSHPDVIRCGNHFYYIAFSSSLLSRYYAFTGQTSKIQSYEIQNGVLKNKRGTQITSNCENQTLDSLWNSQRAFRIQNRGLTPNPSIMDAQGIPDAIKCGDKIMIVFIYLLPGTNIFFVNSLNESYHALGKVQAPIQNRGANCQNKSVDQLITDGQAYNFVSEAVQVQGQSIYSMTGVYPDALSCEDGSIFFIQFISDDQTHIVYRTSTPSSLQQIVFTNSGGIQQSNTGGRVAKCANKSLDTLISENRAFNLNNPLLKCPEDITTINLVVNFQINAPKLTVVSTPASGSSFPLGQTTVNVSATHSNGLDLQCTFKVNRKPDILAPTLTCPKNIQQLDPIAKFEAKATDDAILPVKITYDKDSGSTFSAGKTIVSVTATDGSGNQSFCTFDVDIFALTCPQDIQQLDPVVNFKATATESEASPVQITYDKDPGSTFLAGKTIINVTATDTSGNQAFCTFKVQIIQVTEDQSSSGSLIGIIVGVIAVLGVIAAVVIVICCKKHKKACFKVKQSRAKRYQFTKRKQGQSTDRNQASQKRIQW